jgi:hypothetical protein
MDKQTQLIIWGLCLALLGLGQPLAFAVVGAAPLSKPESSASSKLTPEDKALEAECAKLGFTQDEEGQKKAKTAADGEGPTAKKAALCLSVPMSAMKNSSAKKSEEAKKDNVEAEKAQDKPKTDKVGTKTCTGNLTQCPGSTVRIGGEEDAPDTYPIVKAVATPNDKIKAVQAAYASAEKADSAEILKPNLPAKTKSQDAAQPVKSSTPFAKAQNEAQRETNQAAAQGTLARPLKEQLRNGDITTKNDMKRAVYQRGKELEYSEKVIQTAMGTIDRESGFDPSAKNPSSSAYGLGQYINSTWKANCRAAGTSCVRTDVIAQMDTLLYDTNKRYQKYLASPSINRKFNFETYDYVVHYQGSFKVGTQRYREALTHLNKTLPSGQRAYAFAAASYNGGDVSQYMVASGNKNLDITKGYAAGGKYQEGGIRTASTLGLRPAGQPQGVFSGNVAAAGSGGAPAMATPNLAPGMKASADSGAGQGAPTTPGGDMAPGASSFTLLPTVDFASLTPQEQHLVLQQWGVAAPGAIIPEATAETIAHDKTTPEICKGQDTALGKTGLVRGVCMVGVETI